MPPRRPPSLRTPKAAHFLLNSLPFARPTTFCDVGANPIVPPPYAALLAAGGCKVIGFEPNPEAFADLEKSKGPHEIYFPHAVGDGGLHQLHLYQSAGFTSILQPHLPGMRAVGSPGWGRIRGSVDIQTVALDRMPGLPPFDCLKIDIQGGEGLVLPHATEALKNAVMVIIELRWLQLYEGEPMAGGVDNELRAQGFMPHKFLFNKAAMLANSQRARLYKSQNPDQLIDGDVVYLRHPGRLDTYTDDQLCHAALLGAAVIDSHSLAVAALDELVRRGRVEADAPARYVDLLPDTLRAATPPPPRDTSRIEARQARRQLRAQASTASAETDSAAATAAAAPPAGATEAPATAEARPAAKAKTATQAAPKPHPGSKATAAAKPAAKAKPPATKAKPPARLSAKGK